MGIDLSVNIGDLKFKNPVILASGCAGYGLDFDDFFDIAAVGGVSLKGLSIHGSKGTHPPRIWETPAGMINAIGLQNIGIETFLREKAPTLRRIDTIFIANFYGHKVDEYTEAGKMLDNEECIKALEMNISCPNISEGGIQFGVNPPLVYKVVSACRKVVRKPLWVKLSPSSDIRETAKAAVEGGADALTVINTIPAMAVDVEKLEFRIFNKIGGLSGPAIHPIAVRMVNEACQTVNVPVIGCGGVENAEDGLEFMILGAKAFQVGTALFRNPLSPVEIIEGLEKYLERHAFSNINEIIGKIQENIIKPPTCN
jgi:dihydroorotate dehydrogenase (NAD+) catalytic subunit